MTISKNILLALITVVIIALLGVIGFVLVKPKNIAVAPKIETPAGQDSLGGAPTPTPAQVKLTVTSPTDGLIIKTSKLTVKGVTAASAEVFINDLESKADAGGNFSGTLTLDEGDNPISIIAVDENGNFAERELTVSFEP